MNEQLRIEIKVPNHTRYLGLIGKIGEELSNSLPIYRGDRKELAYNINLVLTEAVANAINHANACDPTKELLVTISIAEDVLRISIYDEGEGFDIEAFKPEEQTDSLDEGGRGVFLIKQIMDQVTYRPSGRGFVLEMEKTLF